MSYSRDQWDMRPVVRRAARSPIDYCPQAEGVKHKRHVEAGAASVSMRVAAT